MKKVLFICDSYHYGASPNAICVERVAEDLQRQGNKVCVVTLYNGAHQLPFEKINGVEVYRVEAGMVETALYRNKAQRTLLERLKYKSILKLSSLNGLLHAFRYPLLSERQVRVLYRRAEEIHQRYSFDYVVCVYHKIAGVLAGIKLKKKYPDVKLVLYTLDAISGGWVPNILRSSRLPMQSLKRWERYFFAHIDKMFAMESHRSHYSADRAYDRYEALIEYLDIPLLIPVLKEKQPRGGAVRMVYTGSMHQSTANPHYLLKLLPLIERAELYIYGNVSADIDEAIRNHLLFGKRIFLCGRVAHEEILDIQQQANVLLNFGNGNPNMIPCKIFEYMSTGNKVLSFTYADTDSSLPYIRKYPCGLIVEENEDELEQNAELIKRFLSTEVSAPSSEELCRLFEKNTPAYFCKRLLEV